MKKFMVLCAAWTALLVIATTNAHAQECADQPQACTADGRCPGMPGAECLDQKCQIPCISNGAANPSACQWGETCVPARTRGNQPSFACTPSTFAMDLNLLDTCIYHFIEGVPPELGQNPCSLQSRLASMMGDGQMPFDIFDLDACIQTFLEQKPCDMATQTCGHDEEGRSLGVFCSTDTQCGTGLYCSETLHRCERECGYIPDRSGSAAATLERSCTRNLTVCNARRGKCEAVGLGGGACEVDTDCEDGAYCRDGTCQLTCAIDAECPAGAYCQMGRCEPKCFRSLDCADSTWYCDPENECKPRLSGGSTQGQSFDPSDYSVLFAQRSYRLDLFADRVDAPLVVMHNRTQREVFDDANIVFGYRLEAEYGLKDAEECKSEQSLRDPAVLARCRIEPDEQFLLLARPFGTIFATGDQTMSFRIDPVAAGRLTPGNYPVTVRAFFTNGTSAAVDILFHIPSPSGSYAGRMNIVTGRAPSIGSDGDVVNKLGEAPLSFSMLVTGDTIRWDSLLENNRIESEQEFEDREYGKRVVAVLNGTDSPMFDNPTAQTRDGDVIRLVGIYNEAQQRLRLIGVVDLPSNYCFGRSQNGACATTPSDFEARSPFGSRPIRRVMQWTGLFDLRIGTFRGQYREVVSGLAPTDVVLTGVFDLQKNSGRFVADDTRPLVGSNAGIAFPSRADLEASASAQVSAACQTPEQRDSASNLSTEASFRCYMGDGTGASCSSASLPLPHALQLAGAIGAAVNAVGTGTAQSISQHLRSTVTFCDGEAGRASAPARPCVDRTTVACGLALYRRAIVKGWVDPSAVSGQVPAGQAAVGAPVFCAGRPGSGGCPTATEGAADLLALQDHGAFYREVVGRSAFEAGNHVTDAFFLPYTATGSGNIGAALEQKRQSLLSALRSFDDARAAMFSPVATEVAYQFPGEAFLKNGEEWPRQMRDLLDERLDALAELVDLERRRAGAADEATFMVAQHALHLDFLQHALISAVESKWEGDDYQASGSAERLFQDGAAALAQLDASNNPLGLTPNRTYFLSDKPEVPNWKFLHQQLERELTDRSDSGTLVSLVEAAKASMEESISNSQQLTQTIHDSVTGFEQELERLCGPEEDLPSECGGPVFCDSGQDCQPYARQGADARCEFGQCINIDPAALKLSGVECRGAACDFQYQCEDDKCDSVKKTFKNDLANTLSCRSDAYLLEVPGTDGRARACSRGEIGSLLQERQLLEIRRKQVLADFSESLRQIDSRQNYINEVRRLNDQTSEVIRERNRRLTILDATVFLAEATYNKAYEAAEQLNCLTLAGTATGTDCVGKVAAATMKVTAQGVRDAVLKGAAVARTEISGIADRKLSEIAEDKELLPLYREVDSLVAGVRDHVNSYETLVQQLFNLDARIADTYYVAHRTAQRYQQQLEMQLDFFAELTGWKGNAVLRRNAEVVAANRRFKRTLVLAYQLVQAIRYELSFDFLHRALTPNVVYQAVTIKDFEKLLTWVNDTMASECTVFQQAGAGDCDTKRNDNFYTLSLQRALFPEMTAIIDPDTGKTLTVGSQFHRRITSSEFRKKRLVNGQLISQIELPFSTWLEDLEDIRFEGGPANLTPFQCDLLLQPQGVAVQIVGALGFDVGAYLIRGGTDVQRSCTKRNGVRPIEPYSVGWAQGAPDAQAEFESRVLFQNTVRDTSNLNWLTAFRDRTLSAQSYLLVIPLTDANTRQLIEPPLNGPAPSIADIRIHYKYRAVAAPN